MYCILRTIENWREEHGKYPREIYIQTDGGSENANKALLGMLEYLVSKRVAESIIMTRLPVGHTHEDIDACFGHIWKWMRTEHVLTVDEYKNGIERAFAGTVINAKVEDVYVIPDYASPLNNAIDPAFGNFAKLQHTQLQWSFEAVLPSVLFPLGAKVMYRAYANDQVVEFRPMNVNSCVTEIGQMLGLEAYTLHVQWYPTEVTMPDRHVEGFYLLVKLPELDPTVVQPVPFADSWFETLANTISAVRNKWETDSPQRAEWNNWHINICPTVPATEYVTQKSHLYHYPLKSIFESGEILPFINMEDDWARSLRSCSRMERFAFPQALALALPTVTSSHQTVTFNETRYFVPEDEEVRTRLEFITNSLEEYYAELERANNKPNLVQLIRLRVSTSGEELSSTGNIRQLMDKLKSHNMSVLHRSYLARLHSTFRYTVTQYFYGLYGDKAEIMVVASQMCQNNEEKLYLQEFKQLAPGKSLRSRIISYIMMMFQKFDDNKVLAHVQRNSALNSYVATRRSVMLSPRVMAKICLGIITPDLFRSLLRSPNQEDRSIKAIFIPVNLDPTDQSDKWVMVHIDVLNTKLWLFNGANYNSNEDRSIESERFMNVVRNCIPALYNQAYGTDFNWIHEIVVPSNLQPFQFNESDADAGIFIVAYMMMKYNELPTVVRNTHIENYRYLVANQILHTSTNVILKFQSMS